VKKDIWKSKVRENTNKEGLGSCYRSQGDIQTTKKRIYLLSKNKKEV